MADKAAGGAGPARGLARAPTVTARIGLNKPFQANAAQGSKTVIRR
jgi:hypothetical protein